MYRAIILILLTASLAACAGSGWEYKTPPNGVTRFDPGTIGGYNRIGPLR